MERLKKVRAVARSSFTRNLNNLNTLLHVDEKDNLEIATVFKLLENKREELENIDKQVYDLLLEEDISEEEMLAETEKADEYTYLFEKAKLIVQRDMNQGLNGVANDNVSIGSINNLGLVKRRFKLPQIELVKFDGSLINWLQFWSQFSKIHNDDDIVPDDKFQYLLQVVVPGSRAYDLVHSFPPTGANYSKVIESLKSRFGRDDLLVEVYVRELLKIVLQNVLENKKRVTSLQSIYDKLECHLRALDTLGVTTDKCAAMLFPLVESCMPEELLKAWHRSSFKADNDPKARLDNLMSFMLAEVEGEQRIGLAMSGFGVSQLAKERPNKNYTSDTPTAANLVSFNKSPNRLSFSCVFCGKGHKSSDCFAAKKMSLEDKNNIIREKRCCFYCLIPGHKAINCKSKIKCSLCKKRHFELMCHKFHSTEAVMPVDTLAPQDRTCTKKDSVLANAPVLASTSIKANPRVFMQTLMVKLRHPNSNCTMQTRVLFDSGSQRSYVLQELALKMGYKPLGKETIVHSLFGNVRSSEHEHQRYRVHVASEDDSYWCNFEVLDQPVICGDISHVTSGPWLEELRQKNIELSDVNDKSMAIGILIGADVAGKLFTEKREQLPSGLVAMETLLGWTIMGKVPDECIDSNDNLSSVVTTMYLKDAKVSDLWELDLIGIKDASDHQSNRLKDLSVTDNFIKTTKIDCEGRYEVTLPWVEGHPPLPSNEDLAHKRLLKMTDKLLKNDLFSEYDTVFKEWQREGIIELVKECEYTNHNVHYLPHRPVVKEGNTTTRIRPVFDASAKQKLMPSLNDCLEKGPNLIEQIPSVLLRFREGKYGVIADIRKAFLQISLSEKDRDYLRFLWYKNEERSELAVYRHKRVVFGVNCSPFLLGAVIEAHLQKCLQGGEYNNEVIKKLQKGFYVDNVSISLDTKQELEFVIKESTALMDSGKFDLRGWKSTGNPHDECSSESITNVLGIQWNYKEDVLFVNTDCLRDFDLACVTKRTILSIAHRIFDPIGFICPVMLCPKLILQKTWDSKIDWDTEVSYDIANEFRNWFSCLSALNKIKIPRWIGKDLGSCQGCSIHTFCDGSKDAYATSIYLRIDDGYHVSVQLVAAKSRVAPLKKTTIPRLELLAAVIGARLTETILDSMNWRNMPVYYWSDSSTVLAWIKQSKNWAVFVLNRCLEIRKLSNVDQWNHISGKNNPADLPSRGCDARQLVESKWWEGPAWMKNSITEWPSGDIHYDTKEVERETKKNDNSLLTIYCLVNKQLVCEWCGVSRSVCKIPCCGDFGKMWFSRYFSEYDKIVRLVAWVNRFVKNCKLEKGFRYSGELSTTEIEYAEKHVLKMVQQETLSEYKVSKIQSLNPVVGEDGIMRLKTKICRKEDSFCFRYPILLPGKHHIVKALILDSHKKNCHAGVQFTINTLREKYWILGGRRSIKSVISTCTICKRQNSKKIESIPAALPIDRTRDAAVFEVTGTDFAGPVYLRRSEKAWICIFTCAVFRAIHLELVTSLSTESFIQAFRRFIARRGRPSIVYSDNGTNYVGASNALNEVNWQDISKYSTTCRIKWKFNPPTAPWWGGWWERLIRMVKELLRRVLGKACLSYQEMTTVLCDCEAVINSRPLTYVSDGINDMMPITPNHFLQEIRDCGVPDLDQIEAVSLNKRLTYLHNLRDDLRQRFRKEYLGQLVMTKKNNLEYKNVTVGDVVLLECDNMKRINWPLALVIETYPGNDGAARLVKLKTQTGFLIRPVQRLHLLETSTKEPMINLYKTRYGRTVNNPSRFNKD